MQKVIKKYKNRKLYDTSLHSYVVRADLRNYLIQGEDFVIVDYQNKDITKEILSPIYGEMVAEISGSNPKATDLIVKVHKRYLQEANTEDANTEV